MAPTDFFVRLDLIHAPIPFHLCTAKLKEAAVALKTVGGVLQSHLATPINAN